MNMKRLNASMTVEVSVIVPFILLMMMGLILSIFYYHDKNILNGAAYETVVVGSLKLREREEVTEEELADLLGERLRGKCILFTSYDAKISIQEKEVITQILAKRSSFSVSVEKKASITEPEDRIRKIRRLSIKDGAKNND